MAGLNLRKLFPIRAPGLLRRLLDDSRGAVAPLFLVSVTAILGTSFGAIDLVRYNVVQGKVQNALDGATLSAGRNLANLTPTPGTPAELQWKEDAYQYFRTNLPDGYLGSRIAPEDLIITYTEEMSPSGAYITGQYINMEASGVLPLISTGFLHMASMDVHASNRALRRTRTDLEVVMALDNTGSMAADDKIGTLKTAAKELASIILGASTGSATPHRVYVGLVPFADTVNVGNTAITRQWLRQDWLAAGQPQSFFLNNLWKGCIVEPPVAAGTDLPAARLTPASGFWPLFMAASTPLDISGPKDPLMLEPKVKGTTTYYRIATATADKPQPRAFTATNPANDRKLWVENPGTGLALTVRSSANPANCVATRLARFLSNDLTSINAAIDAMGANGNTIIPGGLLWAWRMLSPQWRGTPGWGDPNMPRDPDPDTLTKAIVLLTDGQNQPPDYARPGSQDSDFPYTLDYDRLHCTNATRTSCDPALIPTVFNSGSTSTVSDLAQAPLTSLKMRDPFSTGALQQNTSIGWGDAAQMSTLSVDNYLTAVCNAVKGDGNSIKIYTVTLGAVGGPTETLMNACSSGAGYFYNATTISDLPEVFRSIAGSLTELRLTQ